MNVLLTGANGFVGRALVRRLLQEPAALGQPLSRLLLIDTRFEHAADDPRVLQLAGSIADPALLHHALEHGVDVAFHLASVPGGSAEAHYELGRQVNLDATLKLFELLAEQAKPPVVVFSSSIAVFGAARPDPVRADTPPRPALTYGAHKQIGEILLADFSRRGVLDGRSLRLPGVVARPRQPNGLKSAFMSDLLWALQQGEPYTCPVSPDAAMWWMSVRCCVDNLLRAARLPAERLDAGRVWTLPVLHLTVAGIVAAAARQYGMDRTELVRYRPDEALEAVFGRFPPLDAADALALGFRHDGSVASLLANALNH
jgi:nucleoside-diphosphate-sugar epimerase